jgi:hypothetical protein
MMKYLLVIQICSSVMQTCTDPMPIYPMYSSHYNCATGGFLSGISVIRELGEEEVNKDKIYVNFVCQFNESI